MSESQIALHEKFIKGINLRMAGCIAVFLLGMGYYGNKYQTVLEDHSMRLDKMDNKFDMIIQRLDTLTIRQERSNLSNQYEFKDIHKELDRKSSYTPRKKQETGLYTQVKINDKISWLRVR